MKRIRNCVFTSFKDELKIDESKVQYCIYGRETCPDTGRKHLQGYCELKTQHCLNVVKGILGDDSIHIETRRGTRQQAVDYCMKEDKNPYVYGEPKVQGKRNDLLEKLKSCNSAKEFNLKYQDTYVRYHKGIEHSYGRISKEKLPDFRFMHVKVYWGDAGTGKTRKAVEESNKNYYMLNQTAEHAVWFDGYDDEDTLIIDDFSGWIKYHMLLKVLDGYRYNLPIKGGHVWAKYTKVIITSNDAPHLWYRKGLTPALERRINEVLEFKKEKSVNDVLMSKPVGQQDWSLGRVPKKFKVDTPIFEEDL